MLLQEISVLIKVFFFVEMLPPFFGYLLATDRVNPLAKVAGSIPFHGRLCGRFSIARKKEVTRIHCSPQTPSLFPHDFHMRIPFQTLHVWYII